MNRIIILPLLFFYTISFGQLMFPGDTNNDSIANYYDILPIGLAYNSEGPPREPPNIDWIPQDFFPWGQNLPFSGINYGFIDCDGNGIIDSLDLDAIIMNYDLIQMEAFPPPMPYELPDTLFTTNIPGLNISFNLDTAFVTDTFFAEIILNYPGPGPIEPALGVTFGLEYDAELVKDSLTVIFPDILPDDDLMFVSAASSFIAAHRLPPKGRMEMGAAGRGQNAINGTRPVAKVRFIVDDVIIRSVEKKFTFAFTDVLLINNEERVLEVGTFVDTILLIDTSEVFVKEVILDDKVQIFPNPAKQFITVESDQFLLQHLQIFNPLGQEIHSRKIPNQRRIHINIENLPSGVYWVKIQTDKGILTKKVCFL